MNLFYNLLPLLVTLIWIKLELMVFPIITSILVLFVIIFLNKRKLHPEFGSESQCIISVLYLLYALSLISAVISFEELKKIIIISLVISTVITTAIILRFYFIIKKERREEKEIEQKQLIKKLYLISGLIFGLAFVNQL